MQINIYSKHRKVYQTNDESVLLFATETDIAQIFKCDNYTIQIKMTFFNVSQGYYSCLMQLVLIGLTLSL